MRSIGHWGALAVVFALLLSPMALMLESAPGELERQRPKSLTVIFQDGATESENVAEGNTNINDYDVTFEDGASSLSSCSLSGPDAADFTSSVVDTDTCRIEFSSPPDYEDSDDVGNNNVYDVYLIATDNDGGTDTITLTITVIDVAPIVIDADTNLAESTSYGDVVDLDTEGDSTSITWSITSGNEDGSGDGNYAFAIASDTGIITVADPRDIDDEVAADSMFDLVVQATDGLTTDTETITITITDTAPSGGPDQLVNLNIDSIDGAYVTDFTVTDDNTSISWSIASGCFDWDGNGACMLIISGSNESAEITMNDEDDLGGYAVNDYLILVVAVTDGVSIDTVSVTIQIVGEDSITFAGVDISTDTGYSASDFVTNVAAQTLTATLSASPESNESVQVSVDAGSSWSTITDDVTGTPNVDLSTSITLGAGSNAIHLRVSDSDGNPGPVSVTPYVFDDTLPTLVQVTISVSGTGNANEGDVVTLTIVPSEALGGVTCTFRDGSGELMGDTSITYGMSGPNGHTAAVTVSDADQNGDVTFTIDFSDIAGNLGTQVTAVTEGTGVTIDNSDYLVMYISAAEVASGGSSDDATLFMTFTSNEATTDFAVGDITVSNGAISNFASVAATVYSATLTPASIGWVTVDIAATSFTDSSTGESNTASTQFTWEYTPSGPTMTVSSGELSDGEVTASNSVNLTFTSSTATTDFTESDIYANHCAISDFTAVTADTYTATCTAPSDGSSSISVIGGVFSDELGVANSPSNTFTWTYDGTGPSMTVTSTEVSSGDTSGNPAIWLTFVSNEPTTDFTADDITVTNGILNAFTALIPTQYMAMLTPLTMGEATVVEVGAWTYHDAVGNSNTGAQFLWTYLDLDSDNDGVSDYYDPDDDNDGILDILDDLPLDPTDSIDTDGDGVGDTADEDDDGDGWTDDDEALCGDDPVDSSSFPYDTDGDGTCDSIDTDDDGDGVVDAEDAFPQLWSETIDTDGDGIGDNADEDDDGDNVLDEDEVACISDPRDRDSIPVDTDGDGVCDALDGDSDGDAVPDSNDAFPLDSTQWKDDDNDGLGDNPQGLNSDPYPGDRDNDGYPDVDDPFPLLATPGDKDNDGISDAKDVFPDDPEEWEDFDGDGIGDNADPDDDNDGWSDVDEDREGTNPYDSEEEPITTFQVVLPGTWGGETVALDAWDLVGIFGGGPIVLWLAFSFTTRNSRTAKVERKMKSAKSREELNEIAERTEYLLMLRLLGVHQGIKLERIRAELDDVLEAREGGDFAALDQTPEVEKEVKEEEWSKESTIEDLESLADDLDDLYELTKE